MTMTLMLGIGVAVLSSVAIETISRSNSDAVVVAFGINGSGGDGHVIRADVVGPVAVDQRSASPLDRATWNTLSSVHDVGLNTGLLTVDVVVFFRVGEVVGHFEVEVLDDVAISGAVGVAEGCHDTTNVFLLVDDT